MFDLSGKVALVTGGNGGIGLGMALGLARAGAGVAIWGGDPDKNQAARAQLEAEGGLVLVQRCDVSDEAAVEGCMAELLERFGRLDGCFANAGRSMPRTPFPEITAESWRTLMGVNLDGTFFTLRAASRHMVQRARAGDPGGRLVATSSTSTIHGPAGAVAYGASKGAISVMMRALAVELARYEVTANALVPGWIETEMTAGKIAESRFADAVLPRIPQRRWGRGDDFAGIAVYLMSDESRYHTGDSLVIDGGYTLF
ncbi:SDR family NAD(P)-dependent oxidoreductase [Enterovirga sp.]|uniref:SDR family NAD(P)-dependent oxidoreductase n=1 Tax=Enterovirga sp. TaxID=2026350 RepID=UPI00260B7BDD|nr:SDR family NAD(P)-dependent oxidoreductase [Enterovirga sp.]MDB5592372.1 family oxidoreductase [Enterovirga sp.]